MRLPSYEVALELASRTYCGPMLIIGFRSSWDACQWASGAARLYPELYPGTEVTGVRVRCATVPLAP